MAGLPPQQRICRGPRRKLRPFRQKNGFQCLSRATPQQTKTAANHRRRSTFSCNSHLAATALVTNVSEPAAGAIRLTSARLKEKSREKKLSAMQATPAKKRFSRRTAEIAPRKPLLALISSRSPTARMAEASRISPAVAVSTMAPIIPAIAVLELKFAISQNQTE